MAIIIDLISYNIDKDDSDLTITAKAIIEDAVVFLHQTMIDPAEYAPALCETTFTWYDYDEDENLTEEAVISLLEEYAVWEPCDE